MLSAVEEGLIKVGARGQSNAPIVSTLGLDEAVALQDGIASVPQKTRAKVTGWNKVLCGDENPSGRK